MSSSVSTSSLCCPLWALSRLSHTCPLSPWCPRPFLKCHECHCWSQLGSVQGLWQSWRELSVSGTGGTPQPAPRHEHQAAGALACALESVSGGFWYHQLWRESPHEHASSSRCQQGQVSSRSSCQGPSGVGGCGLTARCGVMRLGKTSDQLCYFIFFSTKKCLTLCLSITLSSSCHFPRVLTDTVVCCCPSDMKWLSGSCQNNGLGIIILLT